MTVEQPLHGVMGVSHGIRVEVVDAMLARPMKNGALVGAKVEDHRNLFFELFSMFDCPVKEDAHHVTSSWALHWNTS